MFGERYYRRTGEFFSHFRNENFQTREQYVIARRAMGNFKDSNKARFLWNTKKYTKNNPRKKTNCR